MLEMRYPKMLKMLFIDMFQSSCWRMAWRTENTHSLSLPLKPGDRHTVYFMNVSDFPQGLFLSQSWRILMYKQDQEPLSLLKSLTFEAKMSSPPPTVSINYF